MSPSAAELHLRSILRATATPPKVKSHLSEVPSGDDPNPVTPRLAPEIWLRIISFANGNTDTDTSTLLSLALVSREISSAAYSELYRTIKITWTAPLGTTLLRSFEANPELCVLVRELQVGVYLGTDQTQKWPRTSADKHPVGSVGRMLGNVPVGSGGAESLWRWASSLINLRGASFDGFSATVGPESSDEVTSILSRLSHLALRNCSDSRKPFGIYHYITSLGASLKNLSIYEDGCIPTATMLALSPPARRGPSIEHLSLSPYMTLPSLDLSLDLSHLRILRLYHCAQLPQLLSLLPTLSSLHSLCVTADKYTYKLAFPTSPFWTNLSSLPLESLHMNYWPTDDILQLLPPSLKVLHINDVRKNGLRDALRYKQRYLPQLETLWVQSDFLIEKHAAWCAIKTRRAVGFELAVRTKAAIDEDIHEMCRLD